MERSGTFSFHLGLETDRGDLFTLPSISFLIKLMAHWKKRQIFRSLIVVIGDMHMVEQQSNHTGVVMQLGVDRQRVSLTVLSGRKVLTWHISDVESRSSEGM
jgi:hypothetical protein